ncbi:GL12805 [Drosophila persimilis]|uniref:GL12805 n=1 Tax=Drosophila persimilis TaxID=7234 RepID=B4H7Q7_DROPE|nr:GL12805 [Drosophila persimilis]
MRQTIESRQAELNAARLRMLNKKQEAGDRRQEAGDRRREAGGRGRWTEIA